MDGVGDAGEVGGAPENSVSMSAHCVMWIVKPAANKQHEVSEKFCERTFKDFMSGFKTNAFGLDEEEQEAYLTLKEDSKCTFDLNFVSQEADAFRNVGERLNRYVGEKNGPTILVLKSLKSMADVRRACGGGFGQLPAVKIADSEAASAKLRWVQWEQNAAVDSILAYLTMGAMDWNSKLKASRFCKMPLGNLGDKGETLLFDVLYSRKLRDSRSLLWASAGATPDLGMVGGMVSADAAACEDEIMPEVVKPGCYRNFCFELEIKVSQEEEPQYYPPPALTPTTRASPSRACAVWTWAAREPGPPAADSGPWAGRAPPALATTTWETRPPPGRPSTRCRASCRSGGGRRRTTRTRSRTTCCWACTGSSATTTPFSSTPPSSGSSLASCTRASACSSPSSRSSGARSSTATSSGSSSAATRWSSAPRSSASKLTPPSYARFALLTI
jgi:hypothetical protein